MYSYQSALKICRDYLDSIYINDENIDDIIDLKENKHDGGLKYLYIKYLKNINTEIAKIIKLTICSYVTSSKVNKLRQRDFINLLDYCLDNTLSLNKPLVVYRGIKDIKHINSPLYFSTTTDNDLASCFASGKNGIIIQIVLPENTKILYNHSEKEILVKLKNIEIGDIIGYTYNSFYPDPIPIYNCCIS